MKIVQFPHLPQLIKVKIISHKNGDGFCAELPEYDVFTEADTEFQLDIMINDLIFDLFSVPKKFQSKIRYIKENSDQEFEKAKKLVVMSTPEIIKRYTNALK